MTKIVFINQDSGYLMIDIINAYAEAGYSCVLITGRLVERNKKLHTSVKIDRIIRYNRLTIFMRLLTWSVGFLQIWIKVLFRYRVSNLFIVSNPPIAPLLSLFVRNPFYLLIFDIYPDVIHEAGYFSERSIIIRLWKKANRKAFNRAKSIFTLTESMKNVLQEYSGKEVSVVPVWTDNSFLKPVDPLLNPFITRHKLQGKFIVLYSGNLGLSGDVESLAHIAAEMKRDNVLFLIIGDGAKKDLLKQMVRELGLKNIMTLPWQTASDLPYSLSSASLAVVFHGSRTSKLAIPSKLYNYLSVGAPLLCISSKDSEVRKLVEKYECGKCFEPGETYEIIEFINNVSEDKKLHQIMSSNALKASHDFNPVNIEKIISAIGS